MSHAPNAPIDAPAPVPFSGRIGAMDIARGLALLGIFVVNIQYFSAPLGEAMTPASRHAPAPDVAWWMFMHTFCESKFYSLFSLLFGMGFIILTDRADARGTSPAALALRRFGFLAALGVLHALGLWYGDILFIYALGGLALLLVRRVKAPVLGAIGAALILLGEVVVLLMIGLGVLAGERAALTDPATPAPITAPAPVAVPTEPTERDLQAELEAARARARESRERVLARASGTPAPDPSPALDTPPDTGTPTADAAPPPRGWNAIAQAGGLQSPLWQEAEIAAYREGPYLDLFVFRTASWFGAVVMTILGGYGFRILGLFLIGAALIRADFFGPARRGLRRVLVALGIGLGLPASIVATLGKFGLWTDGGMDAWWLLWSVFYGVGALLIPLAILAGAGLLAERAAARPGSALARVLHPFACTGRMALTNYLVQTLIATTTFYFYGLGLFNTFGGTERALFVFGVYACQLVLSTLWMLRFSIGPAEWVWRSFTYLHPMPWRAPAPTPKPDMTRVPSENPL